MSLNISEQGRAHYNPVVANLDLQELNRELASKSAEDRVRTLLRYFPNTAVTSSFGTQAAVTLHLVTKIRPDIPVVFIDTQYHFPETLAYVEELKAKFKLNLHVFKNPLSAREQEKEFGKLWLQGDSGARLYGLLNKVAPLELGLNTLGSDAWISGVRRSQSSTRDKADIVEIQDGRLKLHPIVDWSDEQVADYLSQHKLLNHPLWYQGFERVGDIHTTQYPEGWEGFSDVSFSKRECGLHRRFTENEGKMGAA